MQEQLTARREELVRIVESIDDILRSKSWHLLRDRVFDPLEESLNRQLLSEAKKPTVEPEKIYVLQGELANAKRYDLATYAEKCKRELEAIKNQLNGNFT